MKHLVNTSRTAHWVSKNFFILYLPQKSKTRLIKWNGSNCIPSVPKDKLKEKESMAMEKYAGELFNNLFYPFLKVDKKIFTAIR